jgi:hypothetical protein
MDNLRLVVIPAAGRAVRLNGLPKFLLPIGPSLSLLSYHLKMASEYADLTVIGTRPEFSGLVLELSKDFGAKICVVDTKTLTETVCEIARGMNPRTLTVQLPDTYVGNENVFAKLEAATNSQEKSGMALWRSSESQRGLLGQVEIEESNGGSIVSKIVDKDPHFFTGYHWGSISFFNPDIDSWDKSEVTIGNVASNLIKNGETFFSILSDSNYLDLGTVASLKDFYAQEF